MSAPYLSPTITLLDLRTQLKFTVLALALDEHAKDQIGLIQPLLDEWPTIFHAQLDHWDAQTAASLSIHKADDVLDEHVDDFEHDLQEEIERDRTHPHYELYFATRPFALKRPVLGPELETIRAWLPALAEEESARLKAHHKSFSTAVDVADAALEDQTRADTANTVFRKTGKLADYFERVVAARERLHAVLENRRTKKRELNLSTDWPQGFFMPPQPQTLGVDERAARAAAKALARQSAADLAEKQRAARAKIAAAKAELAALKPSRKGKAGP
jgi:hypothetical protein